MTKQEAIDLFGSKRALQSALNCSRQMIFQWNNELTQAQSDRVIGAAMREASQRGASGARLQQTIEELV